MAATSSRQYDLILLGATGFTGKLTAEHITKCLPTDLNWAVAGRNYKKLSAVVEELKGYDADRKQPAIEIAELSKHDLDQLAKKTRVLITTIGPYHLYGTPVVEACANAGTHYIDCTGETPWIYDMIAKYHKTAEKNGAILIPQCGVESAPADIATYVLASYMRKNLSAGTADLTHSVHAFKGEPSGGTLMTILTLMNSYTLGQMRKSLHPFSLCASSPPPAARTSLSFARKFLGSETVPGLGLLTDSLLSLQDTTLVYRSWSLIDGGKYYGPKFNYSTGMRIANRIAGFFWHYGVSFGLAALMLPPVRWLLLKLVKAPGQGPSRESHSKHFMVCKSIAHSDSHPSKSVTCTSSFVGDMYYYTGLLMCEAAMVLLRPDRENWAQKLGGGVLTPATLGDQYVERVKAVGMRIGLDVEKAKL